jgi:hypothetical protein
MPVVFYGCQTRSLILRTEQRLNVFKNTKLRKIIGSNRHEVKAGWRKLHSEELHNLQSSPNIIRVIKSI